MTTFVFPSINLELVPRTVTEQPAIERPVNEQLADAVRTGLSTRPLSLPPWLFYDEAGSRLFDEITALAFLNIIIFTRTSAIFATRWTLLWRWPRVVSLRIIELGAGSADKTRLLLRLFIERQHFQVRSPWMCWYTALDAAKVRTKRNRLCHGCTAVEGLYTVAIGLGSDAAQAGEAPCPLYRLESVTSNRQKPAPAAVCARASSR